MKLSTITHCHIFSYSFCPSAAFQGEMIKFVPSLLDISLQYNSCFVCPPSFLKPKVAVACWSNLQHEQICTSFNDKASVFEMQKNNLKGWIENVSTIHKQYVMARMDVCRTE